MVWSPLLQGHVALTIILNWWKQQWFVMGKSDLALLVTSKRCIPVENYIALK
jgi:hypothetical protein